MHDLERQHLLHQYAEAARELASAVERLQNWNGKTEAFIDALDEAGTAHRHCDKSRAKLNKYLATSYSKASSTR
jgi:hypothetical protein